MKKSRKTVYILNDGTKKITYKKIKYSTFSKIVGADKQYLKQHHFIDVHKTLLEVSKDNWTKHNRERDRDRYLQKLDLKNGLLSYDAFDTADDNGQDILIDTTQDIAEIAEKNILTDKLSKCLLLLTKEEQELIYALFYRELTEQEFSSETGIPQQTINYRKLKILKKLKKLLET